MDFYLFYGREHYTIEMTGLHLILFFFRLSQRLDYIDGYPTGRYVSILQLSCPLLFLQLFLAMIQPFISYQSKRFQVLHLF